MRDVLKTAVALSVLSRLMHINGMEAIGNLSLGIQIGITLARSHAAVAQRWTDCWDKEDPHNEADRRMAADLLTQSFEAAVSARPSTERQHN